MAGSEPAASAPETATVSRRMQLMSPDVPIICGNNRLTSPDWLNVCACWATADADRAHTVPVCHVAAGRNPRRRRPFDPHGSARSSAIACSCDTAPGRPAATHSPRSGKLVCCAETMPPYSRRRTSGAPARPPSTVLPGRARPGHLDRRPPSARTDAPGEPAQSQGGPQIWQIWALHRRQLSRAPRPCRSCRGACVPGG